MDFGVVYVMQVSDCSPYTGPKEGQPFNVLEFKYPNDRAVLRAARDAISRGMYVTIRCDTIRIDRQKREV